jgi:prepilin-type N-terminal cleavage/methylation domain-containing protein
MKINKNKLCVMLGFTLVELLIAISIVAILSVVLSINFSKAQKNGRDQRRIADLKAIQNAAEQYYLLKGSYPTSKVTPWTVNTNVILQSFPLGPKGEAYTYTYSAAVGGFCACSTMMESGKYGNANQTSYVPCDFQPVGSPGAINYCVGSQQ